jgi:hypothetical protein
VRGTWRLRVLVDRRRLILAARQSVELNSVTQFVLDYTFGQRNVSSPADCFDTESERNELNNFVRTSLQSEDRMCLDRGVDAFPYLRVLRGDSPAWTSRTVLEAEYGEVVPALLPRLI